VIVWWNRPRVYKALGIEDSSFVRLSVKDFWNKGWRAEVGHFQICIFSVLAQDPNHADDDDNNRSSPKKEHLEGLLPGQGAQYSMFVRVGFGDNEPQMTRVVSGSRLNANTKVFFRQAFQFNLEDPSFGSQAPLYITVREQQVISSTELCRFVLDGRKIKRMLQKAEEQERLDKEESEHLYTKQLAPMLTSKITDEHKDLMHKLGFELRSLVGGGAILFTIAPMYDAT